MNVIRDRTILALALLAAVVWGAAGTAAAEDLGRLFLTPDERERLDRARQGTAEIVEARPRERRQIVTQQEEEAPQVPLIMVNGFVQRSDGTTTAWVNGMNTIDGDFASEYIAVETPAVGSNHVRIRTPAHMPDVDLMPGQAYEPSAQQVLDSYQILPSAEAAPDR